MSAPRENKEDVRLRVALFRKREKEVQLQVAVAISRLVSKKDMGDSKLALIRHLNSQMKKAGIPEDYLVEIQDAIDVLSSKRVR